MKKIIKNILLGLCFTQIIACSPVDENLTDESLVKTNPNYALGILMNGYQGLIDKSTFNSEGSEATDDAVSNQTGNSLTRIATGELTAQLNPLNRWEKYKFIFYINQFLSIVDDVVWKNNEVENELFKRKFRGEALALRAIMHQYILEAHGGYDQSGVLMGIPYYTSFIAQNGNFNVPRLTYQETVDAIEKDFNDAYELLPFIYSDLATDIAEKDKKYDQNAYLAINGSIFKMRIQGQIIRGFQARLHLMAASSAFLNSQDNYKLAVKYANELCAKNNYVLAPDGVEFYNADIDKDNPEILWRGNVVTTSSLELNQFPFTLNGNGRLNPSQNLVDAFYKKDGYPITSSVGLVYNNQNPYATASRDPRLSKYIVHNNGTLGTKTIFIDNISKDGVNVVINRSTRTGYYLKKHLRPDVVIPVSGTATPKEHFPVYMRYTELYLIMAEALNEIGGPDYKEPGVAKSSKEIIESLRKRALAITADPYLQSITSQDDMRMLIRNERRLELCFEGFRFWDLRRYKSTLTESVRGMAYNGFTYSQIDEVEPRLYSDVRYYYMPIPNSEVLKYNALSQNKGW